MIKKEAITGYKNLEIDIYQDIGLEQKKELWFKSCLNNLNWETGFIKIFGKTHQIPRLQAWYAEDGIEYKYSRKKLQRHNWNETLIDIKEEIESITSFKFNSVLANLYRNGDDSMGLHSDDEKELGINPVIASLSLGESRDIHFKHKNIKISLDIPQTNGQLIVMYGQTQKYWKHEIKKTKKFKKPRINLTFRNIITD
ncbi:alpha-ketoglutarate-dependent dioxygenase AlkB [Gammaproteobacteria bacterium]|nr:alpha-ketoglutarate-dependent dioxygenase AlkB [Gammaproteobacteria bacterium]